jgi:acyl-coenzyme A thioesterase PaaI-like protein
VISALLDGAMTNCLLASGTPGVTADLRVRFLHPVLIGKPVTVRAWLDRSRGPLSVLGAELRQDGAILATAVGKFLYHPDDKRPKKEG